MVALRNALDFASWVFQYSLCRVVLMVLRSLLLWGSLLGFQYSLCRVVLMVWYIEAGSPSSSALSVLALSSRFDGRPVIPNAVSCASTFSTRSVESF